MLETSFDRMNYTYYNPVNHELVERVMDWRWSSSHRYVRMGYYELEWGGTIEEVEKGMRCGE